MVWDDNSLHAGLVWVIQSLRGLGHKVGYGRLIEGGREMGGWVWGFVY